jgi:hypothetical protein
LLTLCAPALLCAAVDAEELAFDSEQTVSAFDKIRVQGNANVRFFASGEYRVNVTKPKKYQDDVSVLVIGQDKELFINWKVNHHGREVIDVDVYCPFITSLTVKGGLSFELISKMTVPALSVRSSGGFEITGEIECALLDVKSSGGGGVSLSGVCETVKAEFHGGADFEGKKLKIKYADIEVYGGGDLTVWATEKLKAHIKGSGTIRYKGDPKELDVNAGAFGRVKKISARTKPNAR